MLYAIELKVFSMFFKLKPFNCVCVFFFLLILDFHLLENYIFRKGLLFGAHKIVVWQKGKNNGKMCIYIFYDNIYYPAS